MDKKLDISRKVCYSRIHGLRGGYASEALNLRRQGSIPWQFTMKTFRKVTRVNVLLLQHGVKKPVERAVKHYEGHFGTLTEVKVDANGESAELIYVDTKDVQIP